MNSTEVNNLVLKARQGDICSRNHLIEANRGFIRRISAYICKRRLDWSNDDELSIGLMAFNEAIDSYNPDKGMQFLTYCRMLIRNRLVDYFRKNSGVYTSLDSIDDEELSSIESKEAIERYCASYAAQERAAEISMFNSELSEYGLSMVDLTYNSPKHRDTRKSLFEVTAKCSHNSDIIKALKKNRMLPIKNIMQITGVKRKFLEQWRKYLIALLIIISSDEYLYLREYIDLGDNEEVV